ncbi:MULTISPECIES: hypothetical protein [unclassified Rhizobium]|uniref:hypothetical protein n=1 Tax=unclassified Rhizobium TaxID=2613769 RepID=UPI00288A40CF|nr:MULTISPECIES: hypothetical protein [unclassified Rhizobium]
MARQTRNANQARRLLALASTVMAAHAPMVPGLAAPTQFVRDWVDRFIGRAPDGLFNDKDGGNPSFINDEQRTVLAQAFERAPIPDLDGVVRWCLCQLAEWI